MTAARSEEFYKALYLSSSDAIMTLEPPGWKFSSGNPSAIKMFATKDESEFVFLSPGDLSPQYQPDGELSSDKAKKMIETALNKGSNFFEWTHKRYKGEEFPATVLLTKVNINGTDILQATVRDISKEKENKEEIGKMNQLMIGRELKMLELKKRIIELENNQKGN